MMTAGMSYTRSELSFFSKGLRCAAWMYLPDKVLNPPVVIMANGLGGERSELLPPFAERFASNGLACLVFDYRNFGDSEGTPRKLIDPARHLEDWDAAIQYVRKQQFLDTEKIALWGTSFSGGHVIVTAARNNGVSAIVAQVPFVDGFSTAMGLPLKDQFRGLLHGLIDGLTVIFSFGKRRHRVPILTPPDTYGLMNTPGSYERCSRLLPPDRLDVHDEMNKSPAIIALTLPFYQPIQYADKVSCPALIIHAENDNLIPVKAVKKTVARMKQGTYLGLPLSHFDIYPFYDKQEVNPEFEKVVKAETDFLVRHLSPYG